MKKQYVEVYQHKSDVKRELKLLLIYHGHNDRVVELVLEKSL